MRGVSNPADMEGGDGVMTRTTRRRGVEGTGVLAPLDSIMEYYILRQYFELLLCNEIYAWLVTELCRDEYFSH